MYGTGKRFTNRVNKENFKLGKYFCLYLDCCFCTLLKYFWLNSLSKSDGHKSTLVDPGKMSLLSGSTCNCKLTRPYLT